MIFLNTHEALFLWSPQGFCGFDGFPLPRIPVYYSSIISEFFLKLNNSFQLLEEYLLIFCVIDNEIVTDTAYF